MARIQTTSPDQALLTSRIIAVALVLGVTLFAGVAWFLRQDGTFEGAGTDGMLVYAYIAVTFSALAAAMVIWRGRVAPRIEGVGRPPGTGPEIDRTVQAGELQTALIIVWALLEASALIGVVTYLLDGQAWVGTLAVVVMWLGVGATWPKREWFLGL